MERPRLLDFMASRGPDLLGVCVTDVAGCAAIVNAATQRLLFAKEVADSGWIGSFAEINFETSQDDPFIVMPYDVARPIAVDVCTFPVPIRNQFFEYAQFGFGRVPKSSVCNGRTCGGVQTYDRGKFPTFSDIIPPDKKVRVYISDDGDVGKRVLLQSKDANGQIRYSLDGTVQVTGDFLDLEAPFVDSPAVVSQVLGVQKDVTLGVVSFYELDTVTAEQRLILTMQPGETTASYRRYYLGNLPKNCCNLPDNESTTVQLTAICQLTYVPVSVTTDWLVVPNIEALIQEGQSMRYDGIDEGNAKQMAAYHHRNAIRMLNGQVMHDQGEDATTVSFSPFGSARLSCQRVGTLI